MSIITPTYNCERFIVDAVKSVLSQTYSNWEMIIVDDKSDDNTLSVLSANFSDERIKVLRHSEHKGAGDARNTALRAAKGKWVAFLDSDDVWESTKLERQIAFMEEHDYHFSCHDYIEIDEYGRELGIMVSSKKHIRKRDLYTCCWPGCLTVMYDADYVGLIQIRNVPVNNDTAMWLKVADKADCYLLREKLARYRRRRKSVTPQRIYERLYWHYRLFRDAEQMSKVSSLFMTGVDLVGSFIKKLFYVHSYQPE